jgi:hypothetical protein
MAAEAPRRELVNGRVFTTCLVEVLAEQGIMDVYERPMPARVAHGVEGRASMSEMRTISCPSCETDNQPRAAVDGIEEYRCVVCGLVYYGPCGCDVTEADSEHPDASPGVPVTHGSLGGCTVACGDDWQTAMPPADTEDAASMTRHPGCG